MNENIDAIESCFSFCFFYLILLIILRCFFPKISYCFVNEHVFLHLLFHMHPTKNAFYNNVLASKQNILFARCWKIVYQPLLHQMYRPFLSMFEIYLRKLNSKKFEKKETKQRKNNVNIFLNKISKLFRNQCFVAQLQISTRINDLLPYYICQEL